MRASIVFRVPFLEAPFRTRLRAMSKGATVALRLLRRRIRRIPSVLNKGHTGILLSDLGLA
jgi:hypothetical protein